jgi:alpha-N-acetylglucosaminidase
VKLCQKLYFTFFTFLLVSNVRANDFIAAKQLAARRLPSLSNKIIFKQSKSVSKDTASYLTQGGKLIINASSTNAATYALNDFIKKYLHGSFSETGDNIPLITTLPIIKKPVTLSAFFPIRYALNYCTYNYTMSFWTWEDWEKELDIMALNGVNLMLAPIGTEEVWQKTLTEFGFTDKEIREYIPGPAFNAWWLMGNLEGWGGPVSDNMILHWTTLQQKILKRMQELGIQPVVQSFWGMVPSILKTKFTNATIVDQGKWLGLYQRPAILMPQDSLFAKMSAVYYNHFKNLYGSNFKFLGGDLFHEGGKTGGINLKELGTLIQADMQKHFPKSSWVLQGWQDNPKAAMLQGLDRKHTLILDMLGDRSETWEKRNGYEQFPWVWCTITNFGGKQSMEGKLGRAITEPKRAANSNIGKTLVGVGIIPEGIENNSIVYQTTLNAAWQSNLLPTENYIDQYIISRYGKKDTQLKQAWQFLLQSVYLSHALVQAGGYESIFCGRPDSSVIGTISCCGPRERFYDKELLWQAGKLFAEAAPKYKNNEAFAFDLTDIWRQIINLKGRQYYDAFMLALKQKNKKAFNENSEKFTELIQLQNEWTGTNTKFRVGSWIKKAKNMLPNEADKKLAEWNARTQITYWGNENPKTLLHEYANKEWNGILSDLYLPRWKTFFEWANKKIDGNNVEFPNFFAMEKKWAEESNIYQSNEEGDVLRTLQKIITSLNGTISNDGYQPLDFYKSNSN